MDETTNIDMAAERAARATKTELEMENVRLRRRLMEAEQRIARLGRTALGGRERCILKMWPRFEDTGEPVWFGDGVDARVGNITAVAIEFTANGVNVKDGANGDWNASVSRNGRLKRPAPEVLDADGVPIREGEVVWHEDGTMLMVDGFGGVEDGETIVNVHIIRGATPWREVRSLSLTHTRPDSWERLEDDAREFARDNQLPHDVDQMERDVLDLVRRAKRLAGVE